MAACIAAAQLHADDAMVQNASARARAMLAEWELLRPHVKPTRQMILVAKEVEELTGCWPEEGETLAAYIRRAVATGKAEPALAASWRDRLGVPAE